MENDMQFESRLDLSELGVTAEQIKQEIGKVIVGQEKFKKLMLVAILANGHVLVEGVPGVAKTLTVKLMAKALSVDFSRIQFTPDLMPSDILGTNVFNVSTSSFEFNPGPIFSNIILIDEINRAPAKTQSALFEVMEERQVTMDGKTYKMEAPFLVFATQNPIEMEGTYRLPEAQLDRFIFKITVDYPNLEEEEMIIYGNHARQGKKEIENIKAVLTSTQIKEYQDLVQKVHIEANLQKYIARIVQATRNNGSLYLGASPRAAIYIMQSAKALAALKSRDFVTPEDIQEVVYPVLAHRLILTPEKEMEGSTTESVIESILQTTEVPR
ncbi:MAG: MoxR family ATPase [Bacteroidales bacterium]|nr:MoxR family ATPase [Bacteroidales bacterium]